MGDKLINIEIQGFKSIKEMNLSLGSMNVLIGANGAGKSNFIQFLKFIRIMADGNLQANIAREGGAEVLLHFGSKSTEVISSKIQFKNASYDFSLMATKDERLFIYSEEMAQEESENLMIVEFIRDDSSQGNERWESCLNDYDLYANNRDVNAILKKVLKKIKSWEIYHFHDTSDTARIKKSSNIDDNLYLRPQGDNLASMLYSFRKRDSYKFHYNKIVSLIKRVAPFFEDFILQANEDNSDFTKLRWKHKDSDDYFDANSLSDGTLRFICLATLLLQPKLPSTIIIDEPELGLHPFAIKLLGGVLSSVSTQTQIIISTQSPILANYFEPEDIIVVDYEKGVSKFGRKDKKELKRWLEDYRMGDIWQKNLIGGNPI